MEQITLKNIKLLLEYDGTNYCGFQIQNNAITIQEKLEKALHKLTKENIKIIGCSRTDTGVHAREYCANFFTESNIPADRYRKALIEYLPSDIIIKSSEKVDSDFHSRYSAKGKTYSYLILNRDNGSALNRNYCFHYRKKLDLEKIQEACTYFIGEHDFKAFKSEGGSVKTTIREIKDIKVEKSGDYIKIYITASGFLYNMARIMIGTLIDVGISRKKPEEIKKMLESRDRKSTGMVASAKGLYLEKVYY
ncbi:MAG: tRNA pseudouridine(38-40) synthase TruA [Clostridiaceae bacterium]